MSTCLVLNKGSLSVSIHLLMNLSITANIISMENSEQALHLCSPTKRHASPLIDFQCKHPLRISVLPRNEVHRSLEIELCIRTAMKHLYWLALPGLKIQWLFLTTWKILDHYRT